MALAKSAEAVAGAHHIRCETPRPRMAKAGLPDLTLREKRAEYGAILRRTRELARFDQQQTAAELHVDRAQLSRWESGDENAQTWRYRQHPKLRIAYLKAQAEETQTAVKVRTVIEIEE